MSKAKLPLCVCIWFEGDQIMHWFVQNIRKTMKNKVFFFEAG
jgi:hypothetical protein